MSALNEMPGTELLAAVRDGHVGVGEVAHSCLQRIEQREPVVHAFAHHDPELVIRSAARLDASGAATPLRGLPVAVKDLVDTSDQPTELGSAIYAGRRPENDAAVVTRLRDAGALILGKTVTTEFALFQPGPTANPRDPRHTPGGSSSGSAAATADAMVAVAIGTQTAGSVIRPASFCGVVGFKPTFGALDRTGVKQISPTLDTVGLFGRHVPDIAAVFRAVREGVGPPPPDMPLGGTPRLGFVRTAAWEHAAPQTRRALESLASDLAGRGWDVVDRTLPAAFDELTQAQVIVMEVEVARCLAAELREHPALLSASTREFVERGRARSRQEYDRALDLAARCRSSLGGVFAGLHGLLTPAAVGEAPVGLGSTGDPVFCRAWTLLHCPAVSLPLLHGPRGLPVGVQLVGRPDTDDSLLQVADELMRAAPAAQEPAASGGQLAGTPAVARRRQRG